VLDPLPRTTTRKLKRFEIEKRVRANRTAGGDEGAAGASRQISAEDEAWMSQTGVQKALTIIRESARSQPERVLPGDNLELDLGLDSMQRVELLTALEEHLGGDVQESQLAEIYTVRELVDAVLTSAAGGKGGPGTRPQFAGWKAILAEQPTEPEVLDLAVQHPYREAFLYFLFQLLQVFSRDRFSLKVSGAEKLPKKGPYIVSSNHQSYLDPLIMAGAFPYDVLTNSFAVGTSDIFGSGLMRKVADFLKTIVVDPDVNLVPAMRAGAFGLRQGKVLILYPEGERSISGKPIVFKKGAAILSIHMQVPIVPVAIEGFYEVWPRGKKFQGFFPLKMQFGEPIYPPPESEASEAAYDNLTAELKGRVVGMWEGMH
jgi:long-chain acyl-CoA synthetase